MACYIFGAGSFYGLDRCPGGLHHRRRQAGLACRKTSITPDLLLGDFDSLSTQPDFPNILRVPVEGTTPTPRTGGENRAGARNGVSIYGGIGGRRTDHTIANLQACCTWPGRAQGWLYGQRERYTRRMRRHRHLPPPGPGILSVFCLGPMPGRQHPGGQYPLHHAVLTAEFPLGVSNHFVGPPHHRVGPGTACS